MIRHPLRESGGQARRTGQAKSDWSPSPVSPVSQVSQVSQASPGLPSTAEDGKEEIGKGI